VIVGDDACMCKEYIMSIVHLAPMVLFVEYSLHRSALEYILHTAFAG
jgi:hypothetical protein